MLASQMIYTACGKDKSGAFSVWSKSSDITKAECDEIIKLMTYKKPSNTPYDPTEEEIKTLFPKKYGYFVLSSGRKCVAQSSYIGKVYSDLDTRNGNFIIHAYVFCESDEFPAFSMLNSNLFKTGLSCEEWRDNPAPDRLPIVNVEPRLIVNESAVRRVVTNDNRKSYLALIQAAIDCAESDAKLTFNDSEENQKDIYSTIEAIIPSVVLCRLTFSNQYSANFDFIAESCGMPAVKIRNINVTNNYSGFNYDEAVSNDDYAFDLLRGIYSSVSLKRYLSDIVSDFDNGKSLFSIIKKVESVDKIMRLTNCSVDLAIITYHAIIKDFSWFCGAAEFSSAMETVSKYSLADVREVTASLYNDIIVNGKWGEKKDIIPLIRFVYANSDGNTKREILYNFFENPVDYGVTLDGQPLTVLANVKKSAPFPWLDFARETVSNSKWSKYVEDYNMANELYFVLDAAVFAVKNNFGENETHNGYALAIKILRQAMFFQRYDDVQLYMSAIEKINDQAPGYVISSALDLLYADTVPDEQTLKFVLQVICSLNDGEEKTKLLTSFVRKNLQFHNFTDTYISFANKYPNVFSRVETALSSDAEFQKFLFLKEAFLFKTVEKVTFEQLDGYYRKFYKTGYDKGVYLEKVRKYLSEQTPKIKITESLKIYRQIKALENGFCDVLSVLDCVNRSIFSLTIDELLVLASQYANEIIELNVRLQNAGIAVSENYEILKCALIVKCALGDNVRNKLICDNVFYDNLSDSQLVVFVKKFFGEMLNIYMEFSKKRLSSRNELIFAMFEKPLMRLEEIDDIFDAIDASKWRYEILADLMAYAFNFKDRFANVVANFIRAYVENSKQNDNKKMFKKVLELIAKDEQPSVSKFMDEYLDNHKSFFEKLFGKKKQ